MRRTKNVKKFLTMFLTNFLTKFGIACAVFALICGSACSASARAQAKPEAPSELKTRSMVDETGRRVGVPIEVRRIVTLAPNLTEIVYALGAQDRLMGVSEYSEHPAAARAKPRIGMPVNPSLEAIVGARPDVVLATTAINFAKTVDALAHLGIAVYTTNPHTVEGTLRSIADIGEVIGAAPQADALVAKLRQRLYALKGKLRNAEPARALFVVWENPLISIGDGTFIADALRWAGAESVIHTKQNWPQISMEEVVKLNPDFIVYAEGRMGGESDDDSDASPDVRAAIARHLDELRGKPAWRELAAVRDGHIAVVSEEIEVPAPGLIDTIEQLARELHPDVFAQPEKSNTGHTSVSRAWQTIPLEGALCAR
ncbi:MAG: helical backbone metal receptor [Candidatus Acidiferrales bacterium]